jgi:hypothetical protein
VSSPTVTYPGNGTQTDFVVTFPFIARDHVKAYVNSISRPYSWVSASTIRISPAPAGGSVVRIDRETPSEEPLVEFSNDLPLTEQGLDIAVKQPLFLMQERTLDIAEAEADIATLFSEVGARAPLFSPALTGAPTAPTPAAGNNSTLLATTAFVRSAMGALTEFDTLSDRTSISFNPTNSNVLDPDYLYSFTPPVSNHGNTIIGFGARDNGDGTTVRSTIFGAVALTRALVANRIDGFGQGVFRHMKYGERNAAFGSLSQQWGGSRLTDDPTGKFYWHDLLYNFGVPITDLTWDAFDVETFRPGTRAQLAAWNNWVTDSDQYAYNSSFARDSLVELVRGLRNSAFGYRSLALLFEGDDNSGFGDNALFHLVFGNGNTGLGRAAGWSLVRGESNTYVGRNAGFDHTDGDDVIIIGVNAGNSSVPNQRFVGSRLLWIGDDAGRRPDGSIRTSVNDEFLVQMGLGNPLLKGDFTTGWGGVNIPIDTALKGRWHVRSGDSGSAISNDAREIVVENAGNAGLSIATGASGNASLFFPGASTSEGYVQMSRASSFLRIGYQGEHLRFTAGAMQHRSANLGFYGAAPVTRPTGVAVTAAAIHAALVSLGLIAA